MGKSSLVDSLEYYFSQKGTLERLGRKKSETNAGPDAIRHVDADKKSVETYVNIQFDGNIGGLRRFPDDWTDAAKCIMSHIKAEFIIRGDELSQFVKRKPTEQYKDIVTWLDLNPLLNVQNNLDILKRKADNVIKDTVARDERLYDLKNVTDGAVQQWDECVILEWLNESILAPLDVSPRFDTLSDDDPALSKLENQEQVERKHTGLETLGNLLDTIDRLHAQSGTHPEDQNGQIDIFEMSVLKLREADSREKNVRSTASEAVFSDVWKSAKELFDRDHKSTKCPVCGTEFTKSPSGSRIAVHDRVNVNLTKLDEYRRAEEDKKKAEEEVVQAVADLRHSLENFCVLPDSVAHDAIMTYYNALKLWKVYEDVPSSRNAVNSLERLRASVKDDIERIGKRRDKHTYGNALNTVHSLLKIKADLDRIDQTKCELKTISESLARQTHVLNSAIVEHIGSKIQSLEGKAREIYRTIQNSNDAPHIQIRLPDEDKAKKREASLSINFHDREEVAPGSYLSSSQVHTLALSIRLAAIREFNIWFKVIVLDDVVTSYDVDHRLTIATVLNEDFDDFQIILTTHDEQFYNMLRMQLGAKHWCYQKISRLQSNGPVFKNHKTPPEEVEAKIRVGEYAGNIMRQVEEEWLSQLCYDFRTSIALTTSAPNLHDLAESLDEFLKKKHLIPPPITGYSQPFLESLKASPVENLSSHFRTNPYVSKSSGDERARWEHFKAFQDLFKCPKCDKRRFNRPPGLENPVCRKCETLFNFRSQSYT